MISPITRLTPLDQLPALLRVGETASVLDCGKGLVYELIRRGELESIRLGRLLRVPRAAVIRRIDARD
jgi:excisionase family DNA binding protein